MQQEAFINELKQIINEKHLLKHPFYQMWEKGTLPIEIMRKYAEQYFHLESHFPIFLSKMHVSSVDNFEVRQEITENLHDEEFGPENHRELWLRYAEAIGATREDVMNSTPITETQEAMNAFSEASDDHYLSGAGALGAYEGQMPAVSESKIKGLKDHYNVHEERGLKFFLVHGVLDIEHADAWWRVIDKFATTDELRDRVRGAVTKGRDALWGFLDGICREYMQDHKAELEKMYAEAGVTA